jgi:hypothetical protein
MESGFVCTGEWRVVLLQGTLDSDFILQQVIGLGKWLETKLLMEVGS